MSPQPAHGSTVRWMRVGERPALPFIPAVLAL
jgi:hypothetical protein